MPSPPLLRLFTLAAMLCIVYAAECTVEEIETYEKCTAEYAPTDAEVAAMAEAAAAAIKAGKEPSMAVMCESIKKSTHCFPSCYCDGGGFALGTAGCDEDIKCGSAATLLASPLLLLLSAAAFLN